MPKYGVGVHFDEEIPAPGIESSKAAEVVIAAATGAEFVVAATGPTQYRLSRTYRPGWVVPTAIVGALFFGLGLLLLILVPKRNETCLVAVNDGRRGVSVRLSGVLPRAVVDQLRLGLSGGSASPSPASAQPGSTFVSWAPVDPPPASPMPTAPVEATVARVAVRTAEQHVSPVIRIGGELVALSSGVVVGRNPAPADALPGARLIAIGDAGLSKTHLAIRSVGSTVEICDLSSTNGTVVEDGSVRRACVPGVWLAAGVGSTILAGDQRMELTS